MLTHFCRVPKNKKTFDNAIDSIVFSCIHPGKLVTKEDIIFEVQNRKEGHRMSARDIEGIIESLTKTGFLKEVNGISLERFLGF